MSAAQDFANCQLMSHPAFPIKNEMRKVVPHHERVDQETRGAQSDEDQELIERAIKGDSAAQSCLFATYTSRLHRVAFKVLRNKEDAEDAVQDCWCSVYSKLHTFEGRSPLSTWLTRIVINSALMIRRKNKHQFLNSLDEVSDGRKYSQYYLVDHQPTPEEACRDAEINELLLRQIQQLPPPSRTAFLFRDVDELSTSESAEKLAITSGTLKSRVLRARRRIARNIREMFHADRQSNRSLITGGSCAASCWSVAISSTGEASDD